MTLPEAPRALNGLVTDKIYLFGAVVFVGSFVSIHDGASERIEVGGVRL